MKRIQLIINAILAMSKIINFAAKKKPQPAPEPQQPKQPQSRFLFTPQKSITTYELAMCIMHLFGKPITVADAQEKYMRHFTLQQIEEQPATPEK